MSFALVCSCGVLIIKCRCPDPTEDVQVAAHPACAEWAAWLRRRTR